MQDMQAGYSVLPALTRHTGILAPRCVRIWPSDVLFEAEGLSRDRASGIRAGLRQVNESRRQRDKKNKERRDSPAGNVQP